MISVTCDTCKEDITYTSNSIGYRLDVTNVTIPSKGGYITDMMIYPIIPQSKTFCSRRCFIEWIRKEFVKEL